MKKLIVLLVRKSDLLRLQRLAILFLAVTIADAENKTLKPLLVLKSADGAKSVAVTGEVRERLSASNLIVTDLTLIDGQTQEPLKVSDELNQEAAFDWPNHRLVLGKNTLSVIKVDPIKVPGSERIMWLDFKKRDIFFEEHRLIVTREEITFQIPRLTSDQIAAIRSDYQRLGMRHSKEQGSEIETLMGQVFLWALQNSEEGAAALKRFREVFPLDGAYSEEEALYQEMYKQIRRARLSD